MFTCQLPPLYDSLFTDKSKHSDEQQALSLLLLSIWTEGSPERGEAGHVGGAGGELRIERTSGKL